MLNEHQNNITNHHPADKIGTIKQTLNANASNTEIIQSDNQQPHQVDCRKEH